MKEIQIPKKLMGKKLGEEWVFLNLENGVYYGLNETGSLIWDLLRNGKPTEKVLDRLEEVFNVDRSVLARDLKKFLRELKKEKLIATRA